VFHPALAAPAVFVLGLAAARISARGGRPPGSIAAHFVDNAAVVDTLPWRLR
jgi:membrane protease YdiL (CAAX protease family)